VFKTNERKVPTMFMLWSETC